MGVKRDGNGREMVMKKKRGEKKKKKREKSASAARLQSRVLETHRS